MFNSKFYRQVDGCTMGGPLSVVFSNIFLTKLENDIIKPLKPKFYRRFVDDVINRRRKDLEDTMFYAINNYHKNINFTQELEPKKFLDTNIVINEREITTTVHRKPNKYPTHWNSQIPKRY